MKQLSILSDLKKNEMLIRYILESAPIGVTLLNPDGYYKEVSKRFADCLGYLPEEMVGLHFSDISCPLFNKKDQSKLSHLFRDNVKSYFSIKQYYKRNGESLNLRVDTIPEYLENGEPKQIIAIYQRYPPFYMKYLPILYPDLCAVLDEDSDPGILMMDVHKRILYASSAASVQLGYSEFELTQGSLSKILYERQVCMLDEIVNLLDENKSSEIELHFRCRDGIVLNMFADVFLDNTNYFENGKLLIIILRRRPDLLNIRKYNMWLNYENRLFSEIDNLKNLLNYTNRGDFSDPGYSSQLLPGCNLTNREREVLLLFLDRKNAKEIAFDLKLAEITVRKYFSSLYKKFGVSGRDELLHVLYDKR